MVVCGDYGLGRVEVMLWWWLKLLVGLFLTWMSEMLLLLIV